MSGAGARSALRQQALALVGALLLVSCGGSDDGAANQATTTPTTTATTPPPTTMVTWSSEKDLLTNAPEQAVPPLDAVLEWASSENNLLAATDNITHPMSGTSVGGVAGPGTFRLVDGCTSVGFVDLLYSSDAELTEMPSKGIGPASITTYVCDDEAALVELSERQIGFADRGQGACPVDQREADLTVVICPAKPAERVRWLNATGIARRGLVTVVTFIDFGANTDAERAADSVVRLLDLGLAQLDARLP